MQEVELLVGHGHLQNQIEILLKKLILVLPNQQNHLVEQLKLEVVEVIQLNVKQQII